MKRRVFFIPGLGATELAFSKIGDINAEKFFVNWIPNLEDESLEDYAKRIIELHQITSNDIIAGFSLGGLVAQIISQLLEISEVILISSFRDKTDLKFLFQQALIIDLVKVVPAVRLPVLENIIVNVLASGTAKSAPILNQMIEASDYNFMKWCVVKLAETARPSNKDIVVYNIIGTKDRIVTTWENETTYTIENGSHFLVYDNAGEVTQIIRNILAKK
ncbi:alpha/beta hydrolase [Flavobacteriales bacterium]|nr:alpha/beta hydrolase [Flavobacteriales bacterium]